MSSYLLLFIMYSVWESTVCFLFFLFCRFIWSVDRHSHAQYYALTGAVWYKTFRSFWSSETVQVASLARICIHYTYEVTSFWDWIICIKKMTKSTPTVCFRKLGKRWKKHNDNELSTLIFFSIAQIDTIFCKKKK